MRFKEQNAFEVSVTLLVGSREDGIESLRSQVQF